MRLRLTYLLFIAVTLFQHTRAQSVYPGDKWPDLEFKEIKNYHQPTLRLSDFKGKALLLSFWSHSCAPCIEAFPHLDSMQERFKDRLQVIVINPETADSTRKFFQRKNKLPQPKIIPMVTGEKVLAKTVNVLGDLWFDSARIFRFATESQNVTVENMQMFLNGIPLPFKKRLKLTEFDTNTPLIAEGGGRWLDSIGFYSYFFHHAFEIPQLYNMEPGRGWPANQLRLTSTIPELYQLAFNEKDKYDFTNATTEIRVKDSSLFFPPKGNLEVYVNWANEHIYTYDSRVPPSLAGGIYQLMQQSLPFRFGAKAEVQLLERDCWVLEALDSLVFKSQNGPPYNSRDRARKDTDSLVRLQHWPMDRVFSTIKHYLLQFSPQPLINQLTYSGPMNFSMHLNILFSGRIDLFKEVLRKNGLLIRQEKIKVPVLVITE
jgi:thiol-disulfide isomerase/thioredoxin